MAIILQTTFVSAIQIVLWKSDFKLYIMSEHCQLIGFVNKRTLVLDKPNYTLLGRRKI